MIVCLHGEPTWGYLYRNMIGPLSGRCWARVIVPDHHRRLRQSETPLDRDYTLKTHVENLVALAEHLDLTDITLVGQDWGGPIATAFTVRHPDRVKRIFFANTIAGYGGVNDPEIPRNNDSPLVPMDRGRDAIGSHRTGAPQRRLDCLVGDEDHRIPELGGGDGHLDSCLLGTVPGLGLSDRRLRVPDRRLLRPHRSVRDRGRRRGS